MTRKDKWRTPRDPDTGDVLEVSVIPYRGRLHVMRRNILVKSFPRRQQAAALGFGRRLFEGIES